MVRDFVFEVYSNNLDLLCDFNLVVNSIIIVFFVFASWVLKRSSVIITAPLFLYFGYLSLEGNLFFADFLLEIGLLSFFFFVAFLVSFLKNKIMLHAFSSLWFLTFFVFTLNIGFAFLGFKETVVNMELKSTYEEMSKVDSVIMLDKYSGLRGSLRAYGDIAEVEKMNLDEELTSSINLTSPNSVKVFYYGGVERSKLIAVKKFNNNFFLLVDESAISIIAGSVYFMALSEYFLCTVFWFLVFVSGYWAHRRALKCSK